MEKELIRFEESLTIANVSFYWKQIKESFQNKAVKLDCGSLTKIDGAGLQLILVCKKMMDSWKLELVGETEYLTKCYSRYGVKEEELT